MLVFNQLPCPPFHKNSLGDWLLWTKNTASCFQSVSSAQAKLVFMCKSQEITVDLTLTSSNKWEINKQGRRGVFRQYMFAHCVFIHLYLHVLWLNVTHHWFLVSIRSNYQGLLWFEFVYVWVWQSDKEREGAKEREQNRFYIHSSHNNMRMIFISVNKASFIHTQILQHLLRHCPKCKYLSSIILNFPSQHASPRRRTEIACLSLSYEWSQS